MYVEVRSCKSVTSILGSLATSHLRLCVSKTGQIELLTIVNKRETWLKKKAGSKWLTRVGPRESEKWMKNVCESCITMTNVRDFQSPCF